MTMIWLEVEKKAVDRLNERMKKQVITGGRK
jgi:hypothetical protein